MTGSLSDNQIVVAAPVSGIGDEFFFRCALGWLVEAGFGVLSAAVAHALFNYFSLRRLVR